MLQFAFTVLAEEHMSRRGSQPEDMLGLVPEFLSLDDPDGAVQQIDRNYKTIGGGWHDTRGFELNPGAGTLRYPGDSARRLIAKAQLREEQVLFFDGAWIAVVQPDGSFRTARID